MDGLLDTTVVLHLFRKYLPALAWLETQQGLGVSVITGFEVMAGASNKANQIRCKSLLSHFEQVFLTVADQKWALDQLERFQFSHHIGINDCLIAAVAFRMRLPLYTHNLKDMSPLVGDLAVQPYW